MSVRVMADVWELDLPPGEKIVLLAFADHADDDGLSCYPGVARVAWMCGCDRRTIMRKIELLKAKGVLSVLERGGGRGRPNSYHILPRKGVNVPPFSGTKGVNVPPFSGTKGVNVPPFRSLKGVSHGVKGATAVSHEPSVTTNKELTNVLELDETDSQQDNGTHFEKLWKICKRGSKKKARVEYLKAIRSNTDGELLESAWRDLVERTEERFVPHLFRWIRDERWEGFEPSPAVEQSGGLRFY